MKIAIVGCGYVADFYLQTLPLHASLELVGVHDRDPERARAVAKKYGVRSYDSLAHVLDDAAVELVVNLTNPESHYAISRACLLGGRHVYSEKPLGMTMVEAEELVTLAAQRGLVLGSAPCNVLGEAAQTILKSLREGALGKVRVAYAQMDDGPIYLKDYWHWRSAGVPWPYRDEFTVGCVLEHAGYTLCCLIAFFGPVTSITTHAERLVPDKPGTGGPQAADFSVGTLRFASGVVVRLTCSIVAPVDRSLQIFGEAGTLSIDDFWEYGAEVRVQGVFSMARFRGWVRAHQAELALSEDDLALVLSALEPPSASEPSTEPEMRAKVALARITRRHLARVQSELTTARTITLVRPAPATGLHNNMDFARGVAECADAATERRAGRLSGAFALHVLECTLALRESGQTKLRTSCEPFVPMPWAR